MVSCQLVFHVLVKTTHNLIVQPVVNSILKVSLNKYSQTVLSECAFLFFFFVFLFFFFKFIYFKHFDICTAFDEDLDN